MICQCAASPARLLAQAMGNLRNAKCESAKGNLRNHVRKMRAKKWVKCERYVYAKSAFELRCAQYESDGQVTKTF